MRELPHRTTPEPVWYIFSQLVHPSGGDRAITTNRYKLILVGGTPDDNGVELYDMENDRAEKVNVAAEYPEIVMDLENRMKEWQSSVLNSLTGADYSNDEF